MASSRIYPTLERKPGGPDNWVEAAGGLPDYIERIAKHLHYEQGMTISHAIATAVNTVKRWARKGGVVKYGDPNNKHVTTVTAAQAQAAVAAWEAKKARARTSAPSRSRGRISLSSGQVGSPVDLSVLVERANRIEDPAMRAKARKDLVDLAVSAKSRADAKAQGATLPDGSFPIRNAEELKKAIRLCGNSSHPSSAKKHVIARAKALGLTSMLPDTWDYATPIGKVIDLALTKDGRKSFKKRGRWKHGFVPVDSEARVAKAKGSPIALRRISRLFPGGSSNTTPQAKPGRQIKIKAAKGSPTERIARVGQSRRLKAPESNANQRIQPKRVEVSRGRRPDARATKPWNEIKDADKTIRNGKKYVLTTYAGEQSLTEWIGDPKKADVVINTDKRYSSISESSAKKLTTAALRRMLEDKTIPDHVRKILNAELRRKTRLHLTTRKAS